ncbi:YwaF family protein [Sedimentibacter sp. zth1]|uniref:TMEM164 family acyltransferase n=1 Tax=Sedimentibacter sp. zth1 TaxID=2816908 RepID=UPI001A911E7C|nr:YwaF family protein [Sedimentibacter sp. zth1]QSX05740.1 YwaF family protein [Sedimentibacter sp. zth1]
MKFFKFVSIANRSISIFEKIIPIIIVIMLIIICFVFRKKVIENDNNRNIKRLLFYMFVVTFILDYIFTYSQFGVHIDNLPLELCSLGAICSMIALKNNNLKIIYFLEVIFLPAAFMAMVAPVTGGSYKYLQYYLFMINHGLTIFIPSYYIFAEKILPNVKQIFVSILILIVVAIVMCIFNTIFKTSYMFISLVKNPFSVGIIGSLGEPPLYIIKLTILGITILSLWGAVLLIIKYIINKIDDKNKKVSQII